MRSTLVLMLVVGLSVLIAKADDKPTPSAAEFSTIAPEIDSRLAKLKDVQPKKIGILTYYPNKGGGYTFMQGKSIVFYALPYTPSTYSCEVRVRQLVTLVRHGGNPHTGGVTMMADVAQSIHVPTIGPPGVPFGGQTVYRTEMHNNGKGGLFREDMRLAYWSRDTADGTFHLWILTDDRETRMKVKSIVPVLEHAPKP